MRWPRKLPPTSGTIRERKVFAWFPVQSTITDEWIWLETYTKIEKYGRYFAVWIPVNNIPNKKFPPRSSEAT